MRISKYKAKVKPKPLNAVEVEWVKRWSERQIEFCSNSVSNAVLERDNG